MKNQGMVWGKLYEKGLNWKKTTKVLNYPLKNKTILELGVGNGKTLKTILENRPKKVVAIDITNKAEMIKSSKVKYVIEDFLEFNTKEKFDVVISYYFLNNFLKKDRLKAAEKMKSLLKKNGIILFEDFAKEDYRQKGKKIEEDTIQKQNGLICHFFTKNELKQLFGDKIETEEKTFQPIRIDKTIKRKIINAKILRTR
jgi:SAM-dependent methyltransferase